MKLRTSFFNPTVLGKDITRFAPVWGLYSVFVGLFVLLLWESEGSAARFVSNAPELFRAMGMVNFFYAPLAAFLLFGDLFVGKMAGALHALPLRREGWFLTHAAAGLLFSMVPNALAALICAGLLQQYWYYAFLWLAIMVLQYLFFFGVAAFSVQCAGNRLGAVAVYAIINFLAVLALWLCTTFYEPLLPGIKLNAEEITGHSPVIQFTYTLFLETDYDNLSETTALKCFYPDDWVYLAVAALVGAGLLALSVAIYRKRQLESAGDLIAFRPAGPVFLVIYTLCVGAVLYLIANEIAETLGYLFLFVGFAIAFFTGRMLMERRVKVFRRKNFLAFGILSVVFLASLGLTALDPVGITRYIPDTDQVTAVQINTSHYVYDINRNSITLTEPESIDAIRQIHRGCIDEGLDEKTAFSMGAVTPLYLRYELENGKTLDRYYYLYSGSDAADTVRSYMSSFQAVFGEKNPKTYLSQIRTLEIQLWSEDDLFLSVVTDKMDTDISQYLDTLRSTGKCHVYTTLDATQDPILSNLFVALEADCLAGTMTQDGGIRYREAYATISMRYCPGEYNEYPEITVYTDCKYTVDYLKSLQTQLQ